MLKVRYKLLGGFALLLVAFVLFYRIQFAGNAAIAIRENQTQRRIDLYTIAQELDRQAKEQNKVEREIIDNIVDMVQLYGEAVNALEDMDLDGLEREVLEKNQAVIRITDGVIQQPENIPAGIVIDQKDIRKEKGWFVAKADDGKQYINYYSKMPGDACFLAWEDYKKSLIFKYVQNKRMASIQTIENMMEMCILEFELLDGEDMAAAEPIYASEAFSDYHTAADYGITSEMLYGATEIEQDQFTDPDSVPAEGRTLTVGGEQYECYFCKMDNGQIVTVFMIPADRPVARAAERTLLLLAVVAIVGFSFLAWSISVFVLVIQHNLSDEQKKLFSPRAVYKRAAIFVLMGMLAVTGTSVFLQCLFTNFPISAMGEENLRLLDMCLESDAAMVKDFQSVRMRIMEASAESIGVLALSAGDQLDPALLDTACKAVGADYIIIYDETGKQVLSNTAYSSLTLADGGDDMRDFSRLLKGVSPISKARVTDAQTSLTHSVFGTSLVKNVNDSHEITYWAMLMFVDPDQILDKVNLYKNETIQMYDSENALCISVDAESGRILTANKPNLVGRDIVSMGLPKDALVDHYRDFFWLGNDRVFGISAEINGTLYYYIVNLRQCYENIPQNTARGALAYLVLMTVLAVYLFFGYRETFERYADQGERISGTENLVMTPSGELKVSIDPSQRWVFPESIFGRHTPLHNALSVGETVYMITVIIAVLFGLFGFVSSDYSAVAYIISGRWTRGVNLFAIAGIVFLLVGVSVVAILCRCVIATLTRYVGTKGETIGRLLLDFVRYLSVLSFVYFALSFIGVNTSALVASLGILTFALSLGAQDLIRDILAGLFIVLDGEYQVGDIIEIGGFKGTVLAVGVRTTKVEGRGGNILIVGNRDVKNVINRTRKNSWYVLEINVSDSEKLSKVEALLKEKLPQIGNSIPEIISGPFYKGVVSLGRGAFGLSIIAECTEADYYKVQRKLNGAMAALFEEHEIHTK